MKGVKLWYYNKRTTPGVEKNSNYFEFSFVTHLEAVFGVMMRAKPLVWDCAKCTLKNQQPSIMYSFDAEKDKVISEKLQRGEWCRNFQKRCIPRVALFWP